jgi:hypothetical protein
MAKSKLTDSLIRKKLPVTPVKPGLIPDPCHQAKPRQDMNPDLSKCIRAALLRELGVPAASVDGARQVQFEVLMEQLRCCDKGQKGVWIGLDAAALGRIFEAAQNCEGEGGGGYTLKFTIIN